MRYAEEEAEHVSAEAISRRFALWADRALTRPIVVTHHGRPRVVMLSAEAYGRWRDGIGGAAPPPAAEISLAPILDHTAEGFLACDASLKLVALNRVAEALSGRASAVMLGRPCEDLFAEHGQLVREQLRSVLRMGEASEFELWSEGRALVLRAFPIPGGVAALVLNRSKEIELKARVAHDDALRQALGALPCTATIALNLRGVFTDVDETFCNLVGFSAEVLKRTRLVEIVKPRDRADFSHELEAALQGRAGALAVHLLTKDGDPLQVRIGVALSRRDGLPDAIVGVVTPGLQDCPPNPSRRAAA